MAAELPFYILLGGICGIMSVVFTRLVAWFTRTFAFMTDKFGVPTPVTPAIGALFTGVIALRYPGVLYWGFTNVDEILKRGLLPLLLDKAFWRNLQSQRLLLLQCVKAQVWWEVSMLPVCLLDLRLVLCMAASLDKLSILSCLGIMLLLILRPMHW